MCRRLASRCVAAYGRKAHVPLRRFPSSMAAALVLASFACISILATACGGSGGEQTAEGGQGEAPGPHAASLPTPPPTGSPLRDAGLSLSPYATATPIQATPSPVPTSAASPTTTATPTSTALPTPAATATPTPVPTPTATLVAAAAPALRKLPTQTPTPTATPVPTATLSPTHTPTPTPTATLWPTATLTLTPQPSVLSYESDDKIGRW